MLRMVFVLAGLVALAQSRDTAEGPRGVLTSLPVAWTELARNCHTSAPRASAADSIVRRCHAGTMSPLGEAGDSVWAVVRYRDTVVTLPRNPPGESPDTIIYDDVILAGRRAADAGGVIRWHGRRDRSTEFLDAAIRSTAHGTFLEIVLCLNGTGGCAMEYLHHRAGRWRPITQPFITQLQNRLPPSYSLHKGQRVDLASLSGTWPVTQPGDGNCCPSYEISFQLRLRGDSLELMSTGPLRRRPPPLASRDQVNEMLRED